MKKLLKYLAFFLGATGIFGGISLIFQGRYLESILSFLLAIVFIAPLTDLVDLKSKYPKLTRILIFIVILSIAGYITWQREQQKSIDSRMKTPVSLIRMAAKSYCLEHKKCADSTEEVWKEQTIPWSKEEIDKVDWSKINYESIDNGKDCVVSTVLPSGKKYAIFCIGDNLDLEHLKYLQ